VVRCEEWFASVFIGDVRSLALNVFFKRCNNAVPEFEELGSANARCGVVEKDNATVYWNTVT
jgi:hypothetical protein